MLAPCIFTQVNGKRIAIDGFCICTVTEIDEGVQIQYVLEDKPDTVIVRGRFDEIVALVAASHKEADSHRPREGDEWKG